MLAGDLVRGVESDVDIEVEWMDDRVALVAVAGDDFHYCD